MTEPLRCREPATATVQLDTEHVRVTRWDFNPGAETGWHRHGMVPLGAGLTADPRTRYVEGDFFALASDPVRGFDDAKLGRKFHAVLLDIDHTTRHWLNPRHAAFYTAEGLQTLRRHLHPGGVFAMWSDESPDEDFCTRLREVFANVEAHVVSFPNPIRGGESTGTVYVALCGEQTN